MRRLLLSALLVIPVVIAGSSTPAQAAETVSFRGEGTSSQGFAYDYARAHAWQQAEAAGYARADCREVDSHTEPGGTSAWVIVDCTRPDPPDAQFRGEATSSQGFAYDYARVDALRQAEAAGYSRAECTQVDSFTAPDGTSAWVLVACRHIDPTVPVRFRGEGSSDKGLALAYARVDAERQATAAGYTRSECTEIEKEEWPYGASVVIECRHAP